jgi:hypothetical protein
MTANTSVQHLGTSGSSYNYETDPVAAITSYAKVMHLHTKNQMDAAKRASRRRNGDAVNDVQAALMKEGSIHSTTSNTSSQMSF